MQLEWREAQAADVPAILALLRDDAFGASRETAEDQVYDDAFSQMQSEAKNQIVVGELAGRIVATFQFSVLTGLSHRGMRRGQIESVRVASDMRRQGIGRSLMNEFERRARAHRCGLLQLTTTAERDRARDFYDALGYQPSHVGYKKWL